MLVSVAVPHAQLPILSAVSAVPVQYILADPSLDVACNTASRLTCWLCCTAVLVQVAAELGLPESQVPFTHPLVGE
jgi:hypothetical protein